MLRSYTNATATGDLMELVEKFELLKKPGVTCVGTIYTLKGS
jgi:hypothetical protein